MILPINVPTGPPRAVPTPASNAPSAKLPIPLNTALPTGSPKRNTSSKTPIKSPIIGTTPILALMDCLTDCSSASPPTLKRSLDSPFLPTSFDALTVFFGLFTASNNASAPTSFPAFCPKLLLISSASKPISLNSTSDMSSNPSIKSAFLNAST